MHVDNEKFYQEGVRMKKYLFDFIFIGSAAIAILMAQFITQWQIGQKVSILFLGIVVGIIGIASLGYHMINDIYAKIKRC